MLKRFFILCAIALVTSNVTLGQTSPSTPLAKKPTLMVVPSTVWCINNGYYDTIDNQGVEENIPNYRNALEQNRDINLIITQMAKMMGESGFPLVDLEAALNSAKSDNMELSLIMGKSTGSMIAESPIDTFNRTAKADIKIYIDFDVVRRGPNSRTTFNVRAVDSYTDKPVSAIQGGCSATTAPLDAQLSTAVLNYMDSFKDQLQNHFNDLFTNGREIKVNLYRFDSAPVDFEDEFEYNGQYAELAEIIEVWFELNCVTEGFSMATRSANALSFTNVRMPLTGKSLSGKEVLIDATGFIRGLSTMLKREPYGLEVKTYPKGLGEVWLIIGEK